MIRFFGKSLSLLFSVFGFRALPVRLRVVRFIIFHLMPPSRLRNLPNFDPVCSFSAMSFMPCFYIALAFSDILRYVLV